VVEARIEEQVSDRGVPVAGGSVTRDRVAVLVEDVPLDVRVAAVRHHDSVAESRVGCKGAVAAGGVLVIVDEVVQDPDARGPAVGIHPVLRHARGQSRVVVLVVADVDSGTPPVVELVVIDLDVLAGVDEEGVGGRHAASGVGARIGRLPAVQPNAGEAHVVGRRPGVQVADQEQVVRKLVVNRRGPWG
jgi:hypothetical protein